MKFFSLFVAILLVCTALSAQNLPAPIDVLLLDAKYADAIQAIDRAVAETQNVHDRILLQNKKAETLIKLGKLEEAQTLISEIETQLANTPESIVLNPIVLTIKGLLYLNKGRNDLALDFFQNAIREFDRQGNENSLDAAQTLSYLGLTFINTGKYTQAEQQLQEALTLREKQLPESHELIAASYNDLGLVYSFQADNDKALDFYEKALAIYKKNHEDDHPKIAIANTNIGVAYRNLELYGDAINDFETALKIWEKIYPNAHPSKGFVLSNLAQTYLKMNDQKAALAYYDRALKMYQATYGKKHPDIAGIMNAVGNIKAASNEYDEALKYYQQALIANVSNFENTALSANPKPDAYYNGNILLFSMLFKAEALESRYYGKSLRLSDLHLALQCLHLCDTLIDHLRKQITNEGDKIALGVIANEVYASGVRAAYNIGLNALNEKKYFEDAFYFAEKSKSAVLLEAIAEAEAKSFAGIPTALFEEEKNLKSAIALCNQKLAQKPGAEEEKYLRESAFNLNKNYEAFTRQLEKEFPAYYNLKFNTASPSITQLQSLLKPSTALLSYFTDDKNKRIYIFLLKKNSFKILERDLPAEFDKYITGLRNSIFFNDQKIYTSTAEKLHKLLIPRLSSTPGLSAPITDLIILPTGRLSIVPFEALLTGHSKNETSYKDLPFMIRQYSIRYEFSAGLMLQKSKHQPLESTQSIFLCAPVNFPEKDNLNELPGTASEVKDIHDLFGQRNIQSALYTEENANEKIIKSGQLKNFQLIHFATHGIVDETNPELSRIYLQEAEAEDGNLFAGEIYNLELNANLVTLSACQTGLGKISKGEGVIGLSRALTYAGAKNVIVSFWSVADQSTSLLMKAFYQNLIDNKKGVDDFSRCLKAAKLKLLDNPEYAAPYFWAPFILIGN